MYLCIRCLRHNESELASPKWGWIHRQRLVISNRKSTAIGPARSIWSRDHAVCYHRTISEVNRGENQADCIAPQLFRTCIYTCLFRGIPLSTHRTLVSPFSIYYTLPNFHPTLTKPTSNHFTMQGSIQLVNQACSCAQVRTFP